MSNYLSFYLEKKAEWRDLKAERHPEDVRNAAAASLLRKLANQTATSDASATLAGIDGDVEHEWYDNFDSTVDDVLTDIGFRITPNNVDEVSEVILSNLSTT